MYFVYFPTPATRIYFVFCMFLPRHPQGLALYFASFAYTTHKGLLGTLHISLIATHRGLLGIWCFSPTPPTGIYCAFRMSFPSHPQVVIVYFAYPPNTTHRIHYVFSFLRPHHPQVFTLHSGISPTPPTRIYCVFCLFLFFLHHPRRFIMYFVYLSYTTHRDLFCILYVSPMPSTGIWFCILCISATVPTRIS